MTQRSVPEKDRDIDRRIRSTCSPLMGLGGHISLLGILIPSTENHYTRLSTLVGRRLPPCETGSFRPPSRNLRRSKEALKTDLERLVTCMAILDNWYNSPDGLRFVAKWHWLTVLLWLEGSIHRFFARKGVSLLPLTWEKAPIRKSFSASIKTRMSHGTRKNSHRRAAL